MDDPSTAGLVRVVGYPGKSATSIRIVIPETGNSNGRVSLRSVSEPILLYDGLCGFCDGLVQFVLKHDGGGAMRFATLQGAHGQRVLARHPGLAGIDSLILVEDADTPSERVYVRSDGALRLAWYMGGLWRALSALRVLPRFIRDGGYDLFARYRYRVFGRYDTCPLPAPEQRARFLLG